MKRQSVSQLSTEMYDGEMDLMRRLAVPSVIIDDPSLLPLEDLTVQVHHDDGYWHRRAIGGVRTGCGTILVARDGHALRMESYEGPLCEGGCFSPWELLESLRLRARQLAGEAEQPLLKGLETSLAIGRTPTPNGTRKK